MSALSDNRVLVFDCYGTIIDWESGVLRALQPLFAFNEVHHSREHLLTVFHECEAAQQAKTPDIPYSQLLTTVYPQVAARLGLPPPTQDQSKAFGSSVGQWPAFSDSVDALRRLSERFKLVILSNVDRESFAATNSGPLQNFPFDLIVTAQDVGSYKPDPRNFEYVLAAVRREFGVGKEQVVQTAQSQFHDHVPARAMGIKSSWIVRPGARMGNMPDVIYDWRFDTLGEMADELDAGA